MGTWKKLYELKASGMLVKIFDPCPFVFVDLKGFRLGESSAFTDS
jgi:hypothetical protein